jgi:hypothetical protein
MGIVIRQNIKGTIVNYAGAFIGFLSTFFIVTQSAQEKEHTLNSLLQFLDSHSSSIVLAIDEFQ